MLSSVIIASIEKRTPSYSDAFWKARREYSQKKTTKWQKIAENNNNFSYCLIKMTVGLSDVKTNLSINISQ